MMNNTDETAAAQLGFCQPATLCLADTTLLLSPTLTSSDSSDSISAPSPSSSSSSPPPSSKEEKKTAKKRKSWGQELPVPKTNLPPRKRAKTDDEKEQRRIERVLRNRQAAQSSRERKRQEVEKLESERDVINQQNQALRQRLLKVEEEKFKLKQELMEMRALMGKPIGGELTPESSPSPLLTSELFNEEAIKEELDDLPLLTAPSGKPITITPDASPTVSELPEPATPSSPMDLTQHPAAVLCDLQCQSSATEEQPATAELKWSSRAMEPDRAQALATRLLFRTLHLSGCSTALSPLCQLLASLKKGSRLRMPMITPALFRLIVWLISTPTLTSAALTPLSALAAPQTQASTTLNRLTCSRSTTPLSTFRTSLLRRFLACSPALARPLRDATAAALHEMARHALRESSDGRWTASDDDGQRVRWTGGCAGGAAASRAQMWRLMTMALVIDQFERESIRRAGKQTDR